MNPETYSKPPFGVLPKISEAGGGGGVPTPPFYLKFLRLGGGGGHPTPPEVLCFIFGENGLAGRPGGE